MSGRHAGEGCEGYLYVTFPIPGFKHFFFPQQILTLLADEMSIICLEGICTKYSLTSPPPFLGFRIEISPLYYQ